MQHKYLLYKLNITSTIFKKQMKRKNIIHNLIVT